MLGLGDCRDVDYLGPALQRYRSTDRCGRCEIDPVPVGGLQQLGPLVLGGRIEPESVRGHVEVTAVLPEAALPDVEDLLALELRVHDDGPFLARRDGRV